jgi:hypothetical protein
MLEVAIDTPLTPEIEEEVYFGPASDADQSVDQGGFTARVADQPIGYRLRDVFEKLKLDATLPLYDSFEVWLIPHRISIMRRSGLAEPVSVGIIIEYLIDGDTCSVASLIPSFNYTVLGTVGAEFKMHGIFSAAGETMPVNDSPPKLAGNLRLGQLSLGVSGAAQLGFEFHANIAIPKIAAVGIGASRCEWRFDRDREPLFGHDIETWATVVLSNRRHQIDYRLRFYINTRTLFLTTRRESGWVTVSCPLVGKLPASFS